MTKIEKRVVWSEEQYLHAKKVVSEYEEQGSRGAVILDQPISVLDISSRLYNCLKYLYSIKEDSIQTPVVREILRYSLDDLYKVRNCGKLTVVEWEDFLSSYGLKMLKKGDVKKSKIIKKTK